MAVRATDGTFLELSLDRGPRECSGDHLADVPPLVPQVVELEYKGIGFTTVHARVRQLEFSEPSSVLGDATATRHSHVLFVHLPIAQIPVVPVVDEAAKAPKLTSGLCPVSETEVLGRLPGVAPPALAIVDDVHSLSISKSRSREKTLALNLAVRT